MTTETEGKGHNTMTETDNEARRLIEAAFAKRPRNLRPGYAWCSRCARVVPAPTQRAGLCHRADERGPDIEEET